MVVPPIGERPHQPISFRFPQREFNKPEDRGSEPVNRQTRVHSKPNGFPNGLGYTIMRKAFILFIVSKHTQKKLLEVSDLEETHGFPLSLTPQEYIVLNKLP